MAGAAVVVLWSVSILLKPNPVLVPLPYLSSNSRITEIIVSSPQETNCPFSISIGTVADQYQGIIPNYMFNYLNKNSQTQVISETNSPFVPAETIETMQISASDKQNGAGEVDIEVLGYQVAQ